MQVTFRDLHVCRRKKTCFNVLCTCKATSLSKMAKLVWRYSDDARAIIENVTRLQGGKYYVLKKVIRWKQRMHRRTETRVCKFSGSD